MGGTSSKPKYVTESAVIKGKKPKAETKGEVSIWEDKQAPAGMLVLLSLPVDSFKWRFIFMKMKFAILLIAPML